MNGVRTLPRPCARIRAAVAHHYGLSELEIMSDRKARRVARPRQVAMYLARRLTTYSLPQIAEAFGRDHTTVMHAVATVAGLAERDADLRQDLELLEERLNQPLAEELERSVDQVADAVAADLRATCKQAIAKDPLRAAAAVRLALRAITGSTER